MKDNELSTSRVLDAPRAQVFRAISDPAILAHWWGPDGFSNTFKAFNFAPGGVWSFVMHGPDGTDYPNESAFAEIEAPQRVVIDHLSAPKFRLTIQLTEQATLTRLDWTQAFASAEDCARIAQYARPANEQNLDRLAAQLRKMA